MLLLSNNIHIINDIIKSIIVINNAVDFNNLVDNTLYEDKQDIKNIPNKGIWINRDNNTINRVYYILMILLIIVTLWVTPG